MRLTIRPVFSLLIAFLPCCLFGCSNGKRGSDDSAKTKTENPLGDEGVASSAEKPPRIKVFDKAAELLAQRAAEGGLKPEYVLVLGVREGGSKVFRNGGDKRYEYSVMQTDEPEKDIDWDTHFSVESNGVQIAVEKKIAHMLNGLSISLVYFDAGQRLRFDNPNVAMVMGSSSSTDTDTPEDADVPTPAPLQPVPQPEIEVGRPDDSDDKTKPSSVLKKSPESD